MSIYFDNAATSWPKPPAVREAMAAYFSEAGGNPGRSGHRMAIAAARLVALAREALASLFNASDPSRFVFTHNATHALNLALYGLLRQGDHVVTTTLEHNSVMRPLRHLETLGVEVTRVACSPDGLVDVDEVASEFQPSTRLLVSTHGSNVAGTLVPVDALGRLARERNIIYLVDAAQTAGTVPIDLGRVDVDLLAFSGHKGLLGPTGTGALYIREGIALPPLFRGGTGSDSAYDVQPSFMPDAHESGTLNVAGLAGLTAGVRFVSEIGIEKVRAHEQALVAQFLAAAAPMPGITLYGPHDAARHCGVVSFNIAGAAPSEVALILDDTFEIMARSGLHCAPAAHRALGTFPIGTIRFGFGWFNTSAEVRRSVEALGEIAAWAAEHVETGLVNPWTA
jgi:cysteine desulfurase family protein